MRNFIQILSCCLVFAFIFCSCSKQKLEAPVASYLRIDTALVAVSSFSQGTTSNKITDIWIYVDQKFKGAFPLSNLIPIVSSGSTDILIYPGIKNNGISATRQPYTFLSGINVNLNLIPGQTARLKPAFSYKASANIRLTEGFEGNGISLMNTPDASAASQTYTGAMAFEGVKCLCMSQNLTDAQPTAKVWTTVPYTLPASGAAVYLELNYFTNQQIEVGVYDPSYGERPAIVLNPSYAWNKIYISLTTVVSTQPAAYSNRVYIKASKQVSSPLVYIDNFKLISE